MLVVVVVFVVSAIVVVCSLLEALYRSLHGLLPPRERKWENLISVVDKLS